MYLLCVSTCLQVYLSMSKLIHIICVGAQKGKEMSGPLKRKSQMEISCPFNCGKSNSENLEDQEELFIDEAALHLLLLYVLLVCSYVCFYIRLLAYHLNYFCNYICKNIYLQLWTWKFSTLIFKLYAWSDVLVYK